jgi:hypothetical protein
LNIVGAAEVHTLALADNPDDPEVDDSKQEHTDRELDVARRVGTEQVHGHPPVEDIEPVEQ